MYHSIYKIPLILIKMESHVGTNCRYTASLRDRPDLCKQLKTLVFLGIHFAVIFFFKLTTYMLMLSKYTVQEGENSRQEALRSLSR